MFEVPTTRQRSIVVLTATLKSPKYMLCLTCNRRMRKTSPVKTRKVSKGEVYYTLNPAYICPSCGTTVINDDNDNSTTTRSPGKGSSHFAVSLTGNSQD